MNALAVNHLTKRYPSFTLDNVSFCVKEGGVTGLIGANGAGKTTTLKAITGLIESQGEVSVFGTPFSGNERSVKQMIGYVGGGFRYYPQKSVKAVAGAVAACYPAWQESVFEDCLARYGIEKTKKISQLSDGMKVKFFLALALSHGARLLVLDEPTSGLDPLSREEFCETVLDLVSRNKVSVLFSTHITSDLERIADDIVLLSHGNMLACESLAALKTRYLSAHFESEKEALEGGAIGARRAKDGWEGLVSAKSGDGASSGRLATLDEIIVHLETSQRGLK